MRFDDALFFPNKINLIKEGILQEAIATKLFNYWENVMTNWVNEPSPHPIDYYIFSCLIRANLLYLQIYNLKEKKIMHQFGLKEILPSPPEVLIQIKNIPTILEYQNQKIDIWYREYERPGFQSIILAFSPQKYKINLEMIKLKNLLIYYYSTFLQKRPTTVQNLFQTINQKIVNSLNEILEVQPSVNIAYLTIRSLQIYLEVEGTIFIQNIKKNVIKTLREKRKKDIIYVINAHQYLLIAKHETKTDLEKSFKQIDFWYQGITFSYKIRCVAIREKINCASTFWKNIETS